MKAVETSPALRFGDLFHRALAAYYLPGRKRGPHPAETFERIYHEQAVALRDLGFDVYTDDKWEAALPLGVSMLQGYVREFTEPDKEYEVVSSEQTFQWLVREPRGPNPLVQFKVVGTFDGVWRHRSTQRLVFKEFKTAGKRSFDGVPMDEQASTYFTFGPAVLRRQGLLRANETIREILYTFCIKAKDADDDDRPVNEDGHRLNKNGTVSQRQPQPTFYRFPVYRDEADRQRQYERIVSEFLEMDVQRERGLPIIKTPGPLHMPNCRGCFAREYCEVHEAGGDWESIRRAVTRPWDGYAAHELPERH